MKALTICQPYANLILLPDDDRRAKRVENRVWPCSYRGLLLIHAGKSKKFLACDQDGLEDYEWGLSTRDMAFGAIVGIANMVDCVAVGDLAGPPGEQIKKRWPWLAAHTHTEGPFCFVLADVRRFAKPIPYRGKQGIFHVPQDVVAEQLAAIGRVA